MATVQFFKVTSMPVSPVPNAFYYVENGTYAEGYLTDDNGVPKKIGNSSMIQELTQNINAGFFT